VCFFGGIDDFFSRALKKPPLKLSGGRKWRVFQLASLVFFASMSFVYMEPLFCKWACPFKATAEILNQDSPAVALQTTVFLILGSVFLVILPLLSGKRTFCSAVCPFGAIPPLLERLNPYKVTAGGKCTGCGTCESVCPSFAIERDEGRYRPNRYCTSCFKCVDSCPAGALRPTLFHMKESGLLPFVSMAFGGALSLFYVPGGALAFARALGIIPK
jgi:ferredoxin